MWHGAAFTFIVWGALHGCALAVERALGLERATQGAGPPWRGPPGSSWCRCIVLVTWVFFRSSSVGGAWQFLRNIAACDVSPVPESLLAGAVFLLPVLLLHAWQVCEERGLVDEPGPVSKGALAAAMTLGVIMGYGSANDFIYFQF